MESREGTVSTDRSASLSSRVSGIPCFSRPPGKMCTKIPPVSRPVVKFALESLPSPVPFSLSSFNLSHI